MPRCISLATRGTGAPGAGSGNLSWVKPGLARHIATLVELYWTDIIHLLLMLYSSRISRFQHGKELGEQIGRGRWREARWCVRRPVVGCGCRLMGYLTSGIVVKLRGKALDHGREPYLYKIKCNRNRLSLRKFSQLTHQSFDCSR